MYTRSLYYISLSVTLIALFCFTDGLQAHKPVTSRYTYYDHIQPLFRFYCGGCHESDGIAPMSLMTYKEAYPWAESIIEHLLADSMHPWHDDEGYGLFTHDQRMTPRQLDMIIDWANGGTPEGKQPPIPPPVEDTTWVLGVPDLLLPIPMPVLVEADRREKTADILLPTSLDAPRWLTAIDLKPGYPGMVHHAIVYLPENTSDPVAESNADIPADQILGTWIPGRIGTITEEAAYHLPADAQLRLRIFYRKTWRDEGIERSDRSTLGLYFAPQPPRQPIRTLILQQTQESQTGPEIIRMEQTFAREIVLKSILPGMSRTGMSVQIEVVTPTGDTMDLLRITEYDHNWPIRYDFGDPVYLPQGSRLMITGTYRSDKQEETAAGRGSHRMKVWMDYTL